MTRFNGPLNLEEMIHRRDAFLRDGVPSEFIRQQIELARRQRNAEMADATLGLLSLIAGFLRGLARGHGLPAIRTAGYGGQRTARAERYTAVR